MNVSLVIVSFRLIWGYNFLLVRHTWEGGMCGIAPFLKEIL